MKFLSVVLMILCSIVFVSAQQDSKGGFRIDKHGIEARGKKGGHAGIYKHGASAKSANGKGVEADKQGTRSTPKAK